MKRLQLRCFLLAVALLFAVLPGPSSSATTSTKAIQAREDIPEDSLLDVGIELFDPGLSEEPTTDKKYQVEVFPEVRKSEARYIPMRLKETLESTGQWGAVRVVPQETASVDLTVTGRIIKSNGKVLVVEVSATDSSGREWLEKRFKQEADTRAYGPRTEELETREPFEALYGAIANELLETRRKLKNEDLLELRQISELRFARGLAPTLYDDYLEINRKGRYTVAKLPAQDDPMMGRIVQIRERDYMFVDTLNENYANFSASMEVPYDDWRSYTYEEQIALDEIKKKARNRKIIGALAIFGAVVASPGSGLEAVARDAALIGGIMVLRSGIATGKEAKMHREAIRELGVSFDAEVAPLVVEVEGETVRLTGNLENQYAKWRGLLQQIYATETGLAGDPNADTELAVETSSLQ
jgi:hypothetical protein